MPKIAVLDKHVAELIAAGEVVERPASVVKELVENAIDAGATAITVEIAQGGIAFIRVTDNGCGIECGDIATAFLRHATSKVSTEKDLERIGTLGFRGEALASIASVSKITVLSAVAGGEGCRYVIEGGEERESGPAGCPVGTTIAVRDLFYNTPARMKFLKKDVAEGNLIAGMIDKLALSHPEISFRFLRDGREELFTSGDGLLRSAAHSVLGAQFVEGLLPVESREGDFHIGGFVLRPSASRRSRGMQLFYINGRYVKNKILVVALEQAFHGRQMVGYYPGCVLFLTLPPDFLDVNVHPAKTEVRFHSDKRVFELVYGAVMSALAAGDSAPELKFSPRPPRRDAAAGEPEVAEQQALSGAGAAGVPDAALADPHSAEMPPGGGQRAFGDRFTYDMTPPDTGFIINENKTVKRAFSGPQVFLPLAGPALPAVENGGAEDAGSPQRAEEAPPPPVRAAEMGSYRVLGELFSTYLVVETDGAALLIDKHAAHERYLYEQLITHRAEFPRQVLLSPVPIGLPKEEYGAVVANLPLLADLGFLIDDFGGGTVLLREAPAVIDLAEAVGAVGEMADALLSARSDVTPEVILDLCHSVSCRSAVMAGRASSEPEYDAIIRMVIGLRDVQYCPHGRPIATAITKHSLDRQFGRIQ